MPVPLVAFETLSSLRCCGSLMFNLKKPCRRFPRYRSIYRLNRNGESALSKLSLAMIKPFEMIKSLLILSLLLVGSVPAQGGEAYRQNLQKTQAQEVKNQNRPRHRQSEQPPSPEREFRAAWIATVDNIDFPSKKGLPPEEQKRAL